MHYDVLQLRDFYDRPLGHMVRRLLTSRVRARWRNVRGETVIGLGYTAPFLGAFSDEATCLAALMPAAQGALIWPDRGPVQSALVEEAHLPLPDNTIDRVLAVHCLEATENIRPLLRELWRVLKPHGRLLIIVPNRTSIWARVDATPFGHGRPFSRTQLETLLTQAFFTTSDWARALHVPPVEKHLVMRYATSFERVGTRMTPGIGGVILVEARKELVSPIAATSKARGLGVLVPMRDPGIRRNSRKRGRVGEQGTPASGLANRR